MTTIEAYNYVMEIVEELRASGIPVEIKPCASRNNSEILAQYRGPARSSRRSICSTPTTPSFAAITWVR